MRSAIPRSTCAVRATAERIPGAKYIELPSGDHLPWHADADTVIDDVAEFLTGVRPKFKFPSTEQGV
jgi:pimeloyl-ACP methyl ester carboxylesterase